MTAAEAVLALEAACETWGRRRRTPAHADLLSTEGLVGCALEVMGLTELIPEHHPRAYLLDVAGPFPPLREALGTEALIVLIKANEADRDGHPWNQCLRRARDAAAELAVATEAVTRPDDVPVASETVRLPDSVQVVTLRRPRTDDLDPCMAASPAVQLAGGLAVSFGCGDVADHSSDHAWVIRW